MYVLMAKNAANTTITHPALSLIIASRSERDKGLISVIIGSFVCYSAFGFLALGFLAATVGLTAGAALGLAGALGFLAGAVSTTASEAGSVGRGNGQSVVGASILYGATGGVGLAKKPFKNRNIWFSCTVIY
jgi:ABC-type transport system involved in multi-copper enzyme maturation permease subunit